MHAGDSTSYNMWWSCGNVHDSTSSVCVVDMGVVSVVGGYGV
jgi:hypothetical protein